MATVKNTATGESYDATLITNYEDTSVVDGLFDDLCKENPKPKSKQDWKQKNKRKLPRWAR